MPGPLPVPLAASLPPRLYLTAPPARPVGDPVRGTDAARYHQPIQPRGLTRGQASRPGSEGQVDPGLAALDLQPVRRLGLAVLGDTPG